MLWKNYNPRVLLPIIAVLFASSAGLIIFNIFFKDDEDREEINKKLTLNYVAQHSAELIISKDSIGAVIGRRGLKIKYIENITKTAIVFQDRSNDKNGMTCIIRGTSEKVNEAKKLILQSIEEVPVLDILEMNIPSFAVANVIKMTGVAAKNLSGSVGAKVYTESRPSHLDYGLTRHVMIKGTHEQIKAAELVILNIVEKELQMRRQMNCSIVNIAQRNKVKPQVQESMPNGNAQLLRKDEKQIEEVKFIEGLVSAVDSPCHFWFQIKSPSIIKLDELVEEMTAYYNDEINREIHKKIKLNYEDIVAAQFPHDKKWYRGSICMHEETDDPEKYVVYFVDFGDTDEVEQVNICELRTDFLQLKFQAVEACLANIDPTSISPAAVDLFTELAYVNLCDSVKIRIIGYNNDTKVGIPYVQVININGEKDIDIAEEMVNRGLAKTML